MIGLGFHIHIRMIIFMLATAQIYVSANTDDVFLCLFCWGGGQILDIIKKPERATLYIAASICANFAYHASICKQSSNRELLSNCDKKRLLPCQYIRERVGYGGQQMGECQLGFIPIQLDCATNSSVLYTKLHHKY